VQRRAVARRVSGRHAPVGLLFEGHTLVRIVSERPSAYRVAASADAAVDETALEPELLDRGARRSVPTDIREYRVERFGRR
jgi:hypothetical protein